MRSVQAWGTVALAAAASAAALLLPWQAAVALLAASIAVMPRRLGFVAAALLGAALNAAFFAVLLPGGTFAFGPLDLSSEGALRGLVGALRLAAVLGANLAILSRRPVEAVLDGLGLGVRVTAFLAAVLATAHDLGRDFARLVDARRLDGRWPKRRLARIPASAALLPPLLVLAVRHGHLRRDALRLAGHDTAPRFAALVAVTALAAAGRMAMLAIPNDPVTYAVVFLGGLLFGPRVGALAGMLAMALTNLLISGLHPAAFANAPAMGLLGLLGGLVGRWRLGREDGTTTALVAAACGAAGVLVFSVASDFLTWIIVPDFRGQAGTLQALVAAGLVFNIGPAAAAAIVFSLAVGPVARAADAAGLRESSLGQGAPARAP
ncbi:MAG: DUF6580 family putative transport protein [Candidatus Thermoplasmatota archaeon]